MAHDFHVKPSDDIQHELGRLEYRGRSRKSSCACIEIEPRQAEAIRDHALAVMRANEQMNLTRSNPLPGARTPHPGFGDPSPTFRVPLRVRLRISDPDPAIQGWFSPSSLVGRPSWWSRW